MGFYWKPWYIEIKKILRWLSADERERKILKYVPPRCQICDVLAFCRDEKNNWKCRNGCQFIKK